MAFQQLSELEAQREQETTPTTPTDSGTNNTYDGGGTDEFRSDIDPMTLGFMDTIKTILQQQREDADRIWPLILEGAGYITDTETGDIRRMTETERLNRMDPAARARYESDLLLLDRQKKALAGELELPVGTQQQIEKQREALDAGLSQRLGPGYKGSTAGIQAQAEQNAIELAALDAFRRGELQTGMGLLAGNQAQINAANQAMQGTLTGYQNRSAGTMQGYFGLMNPLQASMDRQNQRDLASTQRDTQLMSGLLGTAGMLGGAGLSLL